MRNMKAGVQNRIHPERGATGFTKLDGTIKFYSFVKAIIRDHGARRVMDFGAGRGAFFSTESAWRRELQDLRQYGAQVWACDIKDAVTSHPCSDHQMVTTSGEKLPFDDEFFDLVVADFTFEHITDPSFTASELVRVLRTGGMICARTPNRYGYVKIFTQLVPNSMHARFLRLIQPDRRAEDVFPTAYKLNSVRQVERYFQNCSIYWYRDSAEPAYFFGNSILYRFCLLIHKFIPDVMATSICFFIRKGVES